MEMSELQNRLDGASSLDGETLNELRISLIDKKDGWVRRGIVILVQPGSHRYRSKWSYSDADNIYVPDLLMVLCNNITYFLREDQWSGDLLEYEEGQIGFCIYDPGVNTMYPRFKRIDKND